MIQTRDGSISSTFAFVLLKDLADLDVIKWVDRSIVKNQVIRVQLDERCPGDRHQGEREGSGNQTTATEPVQQVREHS